MAKVSQKSPQIISSRNQIVTSEFYFVRSLHKGDLFKELEDAFENMNSISERNQSIEEGFRRIGDLRENGAYWRGVVYRLRVNPDAQIGEIDKEVTRSLGLGTNEALAEYCGFLYYPSINVLVLHRNRDAGGHVRLEDYLNFILPQFSISLDPIFNLDAYRRLHAMNVIQKFELKIAQPASLKGINLPNWLIEQARAAADQEATSFEVAMSIGRSKKSLGERVKSWLESVAKDVPTAEKVRVIGKINGEDAIVDLLQDRMYHKSQVTVSGVAIAPTEIYSGLLDSYLARESELRVLFDRDKKARGDL